MNSTGETRILGIDPGSRTTGYGVVACRGQQVEWLDSGQVALGADAMSARLSALFDRLQELFVAWQPAEVAVENVFVCRNVQSALKLGQARGVVLLAAGRHDLDVHEYAPNAIKKAVVGRGHADKAQVQLLIRALLKMRHSPKADEADALAIAVCHAHHRASRSLQAAALQASS